MRRLLYFPTLAIILLALSITAMAQSGGSYTLIRSVIATGGGPSSGGTYTLNGTAGQSAVGISSATDQVLSSGYWTASLIVPTAIQLALTGSAESPLAIPLYAILLSALILLTLAWRLRRH